jgi:serine/threonine-protein kinase
MADVFVSYKAEDRRRVQPLVQALQADGLTVWWDEQISGGDDWRDQIQRHLDEAKCVVVVWSRRSIGPDGHFVRDEAVRAQRRHVYLPVRIDKIDPPLGFGETQAISLAGWSGDRSHPRYQAVLAAARAIVSGGPRPAMVESGEPLVSRRAVVAGSAAVVAAAAGGWYLLKPGAAEASNSIAVLPFANLSGDSDQAYFADGLAEELRSALSRIGNLKVIGRVSSEAVRDSDATDAAHKLRVGSLLTGSVRRSPSIIRVSAQLLDGKDGAQRWAETYDRPPGDALAVQADIAEKVVAALSIQLGQGERDALKAGGTENAEAHDLYLKAQALWRQDQSQVAIRRAIGLLDAAVAIDPRFANAHATKALYLAAETGTFANNKTAYVSGYAQAEAAARQAIALTPKLALGYAALGQVAQARLDVATGLAMFERALSYAPRDTEALSGYARLLGDIGRTDESLKLSEELLRLDPLDPKNYSFRALILYYARRYPEAIRAARRSLEFSPKRYIARVRVGNALIMLGEPKEALAEYTQVPAGDPWRLVGEAIATHKVGDRAASDRAFSELVASFGDAFSYQQAEIHAQRGEQDRAFAALQRAVKVPDPGLLAIRVDPFMDPIRSDPRFATIERALRFP